MLDSPDLDTPQFDEADLDAYLARAISRSAGLHAVRTRRRAAASALVAVAVLVVGLVVALPGAHPNPNRVAGGHVSQLSWRLVDDVTGIASWETVTANGYQPSFGLTCPAAGTCYAVAGGQIEFSHDGGATWQQATAVNTLAPLNDISCVDADHCSVFGTAADGASTFFTTTDGGTSWTSRPGPAQISSGAFFSTLSCSSPTSCVVVAANSDMSPAGGPVGPAPFVMATSDGGVTWARESILGASFAPTVLSCEASGVCIVSGIELGMGSSLSTMVGAAYVSTDGGTTWTAATLPTGAGPLTSLSCPTSSECFAISRNLAGGSLLATSDGGMTWTEQSATGLPSLVLGSISCPAVSSCWLGAVVPPAGDTTAVPIGKGQGILAWSGDGASTWQQVAVPNGVGPVTDVACPNTTTCYALGFEASPSGTGKGQVVLLSTSSPQTAPN